MRNKFGQFVKGNIPWTKGIGHSEETKKKISQHNYWTGKLDELSAQWKGDDVSYVGLHKWIYSRLGKAIKCENPNCFYPRWSYREDGTKKRYLKSPKRYEWANVSGKYLRDLKDFVQLCSSCHKQYDNKKLILCPK